MAEELQPIRVPVEADTSKFKKELQEAERQAEKFGKAISTTLVTAIRQGKTFEDTLKSIALDLSKMALQSAMQPLQDSMTGLFSNLLLGLTGPGGSTGSILPFAKGGVVAAPTYFSSGSRLGVMGEAGAEAVLPLARGSDGRLGVASSGDTAPTQIIFNISTPDAQGFRKSQAQIAAMLTRTVNRGRRTL